ncbi:hypothetical protein L596_012954 [Steinernema carpocapsae]|uniref:TIL domain-containing protein n=1 Tax=Steinernema carpocapsae TaxID=34508 RepID=A0A4U5NYL9_STECR|nr:hypothetical protein L596_012954 [Steinernema carpocapsae]
METHVWSVAADFKTERDETPDWSCHKMTTDLNWFLSLPVTDGHLNFEKMVLDRSNDETVTRVGVRRTSARQSVFYLVIKMSLTYLVLLALFVALAASAPQKPKCGPNEFFNSCTGCENFCTDMGLKPCPLVCKMPGECRCDFGFARDVSGNCVDRLTCPPNACPRTRSGKSAEAVKSIAAKRSRFVLRSAVLVDACVLKV